jgi:hypothetical protein
VVDLDGGAARRVAAQIGGGAVAIEADVSTEDGCAAAVAAVESALGPVDVLFNNAGIGLSSLRPDAERNLPGLQEVTPEIFDRFIAVNLRGPYLMTRLVTPGMRQRGWGRVVNNTTSFFTMLRAFPYGALKASLEAASAIWAYQVRLVLALTIHYKHFRSVEDLLVGVFTTSGGALFLLIGTLIGGFLATVLYTVTVIAMPLLLDRNVDFVTAMITSVRTVLGSPVVMLGWGAAVGALTLLAIAPALVGVIFVFPFLGHTTWHLYERLISEK